MSWSISSKAAVCGVGKTRFERPAGRNAIWQTAEALRLALDDAGLQKSDIDGLYINGGGDFDQIADLLGLDISAANQFWLHGRMCAATLQTAALSVAAGFAKHVACIYAINMEDRGGGFGGGRSHGWEEFREGGGAHGEVAYYGLTHPGSGAAMAWQRYMHEYGATDRHLARVATTTREHARLNPDALKRDPMTEQDYFASRLVIEPLRLFDFAVVNDGAVCIIVTSAERARDCRKPPVYLAGMQPLGAGREKFVFAPPGLPVAKQSSGRRETWEKPAFEMAGITHEDVDLFLCLDSFSPLVIFALEQYGYCKPGEGAAWIEEGHGRLGGKMPINTHGGHLSEGMMGSWAHQVEAVRQLRNECGDRQVPSAHIAHFGMGQGVSLVYSNQV